MNAEQIAPWILALAFLALGGSLVALGGWLLPKLKSEEQGYPLEAQIEAALLPLAFQAICAAYRLSEQAMDEVGERLHGLDKKAIADQLYDLLPEQIGKFPLHLVKHLVSRERFEQLVQDAFARFDRDFVAFGDRYAELFAQWRQEYENGPRFLAA